MQIIEKAKKWLLSVAIKKAVNRVVQLAIAYTLALQPQKYGVTVDEQQLTAAIFGALEVGRNWLKQKPGWEWL